MAWHHGRALIYIQLCVCVCACMCVCACVCVCVYVFECSFLATGSDDLNAIIWDADRMCEATQHTTGHSGNIFSAKVGTCITHMYSTSMNTHNNFNQQHVVTNN